MNAQCDLNNLTDEELVERVTRRDAEAFNVLSDRYAGLIYATAMRVLNKSHDAEDLRQQVLILLWDKLPAWDPQKGRLSTWICSVTRNRAIDVTRKWRSQSNLIDRFTNETKETWGDESSPTTSSIASLENHQLARKALARLRAEDRSILSQVYFQDLTHAEVARRNGMPLGTVKAKVSRALKQLRRIAQGYQFAEMAPAAA